ncbi:MAG: hypothetical protein K8R18_16025 [Parvibaculum sp.]|uniref:hypothetical protein n=1 Tax=Parvibaculum sp. TaxID=2024848 RepID=UPI0025DA5374|nr:hypothetical protein [Parvibaculum sp.]MCE9651127.1 hypothetical protein [Parvibaculum sp.]
MQKKSRRRISRAAAFAGLAGLVLAFCLSGLSPARAADASVGAAVGKPLKEAQGLSKAGNYADALKKVKTANALSGKTPYESFVIDDFMAFLNVKLKDYAAAAQAAEAALATGEVPAKDRPERLKTLVQLNYTVKNYDKAVAFAKQYQQAAGPDAEMQRLVTQAYYLQKDYHNAEASAKALAASQTAAGRKPDEAILQLWLSSAFYAQNKSSQRAALTALVESYPSQAYIGDLLNLVEADLGRSDRMSLEVFRLKLAAAMLKTSDEYIEMAQLAIQLGFPGEARAVMAKGFTAGVLGGKNKSREQRLETMAKQQAGQDEPTLAATADTPKAKAALAEAYASYGKADKAIALYNEVLAAGPRDADIIRLHLGQAYLAKGDAASARKSFAAVGDAKLAGLAHLWITVARGEH